VTDNQFGVRHATRLVYKALHTSLSPVNDPEYRELLGQYRANPAFATQVQDVATGMELIVLDVSERGLIVVPSSRESRFAVRMTDIRAGLDAAQKASLLLAHVAIAAVFFPTTDGLDADNYTPPPSSVSNCRDTLYALARRLKESSSLPADIPSELAPGWEAVSAMPLVLPAGQRASPNSLVGIVKLALGHMQANGLVRLDRDADEDASVMYTATHRLRVQLRELALRRLFDIAQEAVRTPAAAEV
jgi:hypothetical protein